MGAKTWMIVYSDGNAPEVLKSNPVLDKDKTKEYLATLFPDEELVVVDEDDLSFTCPEDDEICAGFFNGVFIIAAKEFGIDYPSCLPEHFLTTLFGHTLQLHAMYSAVDWFAFAWWENKQLKRALSLSPDSGILEDIGDRFEFEKPYWEGQYPVDDLDDDEDEGYDDDGEDDEAYPFEFHPLELAEEALKNMFGYQLEGYADDSLIEPEDIPLLVFKRSKK